MFGLDSTRPLWIVRKNGNIAVWPRGGLFSGPLVVAGAMYDVKGHGIEANHPTARTESAAGPSSPFGSYAFPTYSTSRFAQAPHPPAKKKKGFGKTIIVVSLKRKSGSVASKGNTHPKLEYEIVTQVTVLLDSSTSNVRKVTELVVRQFDQSVILLDSKCYPILENESTSSECFWKTSRKILVANRDNYDKLTGQSTTRVGKASFDLTGEDMLPSAGKRPRY